MLKVLVGLIAAALLLWVGATGRLGSLLGALVTPDYMVQGTPPVRTGTSGSNGAQGTVNQATKQIVPSSGTLKPVEIAQYAVGAGLTSNIATAVAIALAESSGNIGTTAGPNSDGSFDYGLWQINGKAHPTYSSAQLLDPSYNAAAMVTISNNGADWTPWTTYKYDANGRYVGPGKGFYLNFMSQGQDAANQVIAGI